MVPGNSTRGGRGGATPDEADRNTIDITAGPVLEVFDRGIVVPSFRLGTHTKRVGALMRRYQDQGISLADARIIRMSEVSVDCLLLTPDGGFRIYRRSGRQAIPLSIPAEL